MYTLAFITAANLQLVATAFVLLGRPPYNTIVHAPVVVHLETQTSMPTNLLFYSQACRTQRLDGMDGQRTRWIAQL